ncbi:endoglycoceramidase I [Jongsikchunia kroppenstedtii]|uniref:endoglycoceramidase I n=1 Tax=Jongsikchunia kroppenstedtii TaxID=1121721 RepID=UPI00035C2B9E|nr:cellulase family glycosylhydrolase [Jongsikchunia kroppenstedtii]
MRSHLLVVTLVVTIAAVVASVLLISTQPASAAPTGGVVRIHTQGDKIYDQYGRVLLLHGVNSVDKSDGPLIVPGNGYTITAPMAATLARHGINNIRLGVSFQGLMPTRGQLDHAYLDRIAAQVEILASHGIRTLLDNHQDGLGSPWGGNGFPAWSIHARPAPGESNPGFPMNYLMPSMSAGWSEVWNNTYGVLDYLGQALGALTARVQGHPGVMGIELLNEPWPGTGFLTCYPFGCPGFDAKYQRALTTLTNAVRAKDPSMTVFWEPNVTWNQLMPSNLGRSAPIPPNVVFAPHDYCIPSQLAIYLGLPQELRTACPLQHGVTWGNVNSLTARTHIPTVIGEFGDNDASILDNTLDPADKHFTGWEYWPPAANTYPLDSGPVADKLVRTYPQATAGMPQRMQYDSGNGDFAYRYSPGPAARPTEIYVSDIKYPTGYIVNVVGGGVTSAPNARIVTIAASGGGPVTVKINRPGSAGITLPSGNDGGSVGASGSSTGSAALGGVVGLFGS